MAAADFAATTAIFCNLLFTKWLFFCYSNAYGMQKHVDYATYASYCSLYKNQTIRAQCIYITAPEFYYITALIML